MKQERCPLCDGPEHEHVNGLSSGCFRAVREALKSLPLGKEREFALRNLAEIACQLTVVANAKREAESAFRSIWEDAESARHRAHQAHVEFGGLLYEEES